jgi:hypothetical protein
MFYILCYNFYTTKFKTEVDFFFTAVTAMNTLATTKLTNSMRQNPFSENDSHSGDQEIPCHYGIQKFIIVFTRGCPWTLFKA